MGWLGWTEKQALKTDINSAILAIECKGRLLRAQAGVKEEEEPEPITPKTFKDHVARHNNVIGANDDG